MPPALLFFLKIALATQNPSWFHTTFRVLCSISVKNATGILIETALNLSSAVECMDIVISEFIISSRTNLYQVPCAKR